MVLLLWVHAEYFTAASERTNDFRGASQSQGISVLRSGFVSLIPCWVVMLSDRYMYKLSEPWETHRFSLSCAAPPGVTDTTNECKLSSFCVFTPFTSLESTVSSSKTDTFCFVWATACQFWSLSHWCRLPWDTAPSCTQLNWTVNSPVCYWPLIQLSTGFRSLFKFTLHVTHLLNKFTRIIKLGENSCGINKRF